MSCVTMFEFKNVYQQLLL